MPIFVIIGKEAMDIYALPEIQDEDVKELIESDVHKGDYHSLALL